MCRLPFGSAFMFARAFARLSHKALDVSPLLEGRLPRAWLQRRRERRDTERRHISIFIYYNDMWL